MSESLVWFLAWMGIFTAIVMTFFLLVARQNNKNTQWTVHHKIYKGIQSEECSALPNGRNEI